jgi:hypothetical protein
MPKEEWDSETIARAVGLKRAGFSSKYIAEKLGKTREAVQSKLKRVGAKRRLDGRGGSAGGVSFGRDRLHRLMTVSETVEILGVSSQEEEQDDD